MSKRWMLIGVGLLAAVLMLGIACDDDDDDGDDDGDEPAATEPADGDGDDGADDGTNGDGGDGEGAIRVQLLEFQLVPEVESTAAGPVTFNADNIGGSTHNLFVIQTDLAPDALPALDDQSFDEAGEGVTVVGGTSDIDAGGDELLEVDLTPGAYVLICNIVDDSGAHYLLGMTAAFEVVE